MRFFGYHGVFPEENKLGQQYIVDLELLLDLSEAAATDDLGGHGQLRRNPCARESDR